MAWVIDTCVVSDIWTGDALFAESSALCLNHYQRDGLILCPISYIELGPIFRGSQSSQEEFLSRRRIDFSTGWTTSDTNIAHQMWHDYTTRRRAGLPHKRPIADGLIAAFAARFQGLITRNVDDFRKVAPNLSLVDASAFKPAA